MKIKLVYLTAPALVLVSLGCQSRQAYIVPARNQAAEHREVSEVNVRSTQVPKVRRNEMVKVYAVNRYVDPADPNVLHERHAIYRVEQQPSWVTRSRRGGEILLGPLLGLRHPEYAPEPEPGEAAREVMQARRGLQETSTNIQSLQDTQLKLAGSVEALAKQTAEAQQKLTSVVTVLNQRLKRLESDGGIPVEAAADPGAPPISATVRAPQ